MPLPFALGQHEASQAVSRQLRPDERLFAFLDECIRVHTGETKIWNQTGLRREVYIPRVGWPQEQSKIGCPGRRGWRTLVG